MILNQYQNQPNFQGNLLKESLQLPQKKFNEVAQKYAKRAKGMPDMTLKGVLDNSDFDGRFFHSTHAIIGGQDAASIVTSSFKSMFNKLSPKKIADELVNITRNFMSQEKGLMLMREIQGLQGKIQTIRTKLQLISNPEHAKRLEALVKSMESNLAKKEQKYSKFLQEQKKVSGEWCM